MQSPPSMIAMDIAEKFSMHSKHGEETLAKASSVKERGPGSHLAGRPSDDEYMSTDEIHPSMELSHQIECALNRVLEDMKKASELFHHSASEGDALEAANLQLLATFRF